MDRTTPALFLALVSILGAHSASRAQEVEANNRIRLEAYRPELKNSDYLFPSSAWFLTFHESVEGPVHVDMQIPFAYVGQDKPVDNEWEFRLANPYLGLSWSSPDNPATLGFGMRIPILPDDAAIRVMRAADIHRYEAFTPDLWDFSFHSVVGDETTPVRARVRTSLWVPLHRSVQIVTDYAFGVQRPVPPFFVRIEVLGRAGLTADNLFFGERSMHQAGLTVEALATGVRPGIFVRAPLQGREVVDWVAGVSLSF